MPAYVHDPDRPARDFLAVAAFQRHMTDEGWQLQEGLRHAGYRLWGHGYPDADVDVNTILKKTQPGVMIVQDKREWDSGRAGCFEKGHDFRHVEVLARDPSIFRVTICKDAHQDPGYHADFANQIGCHAWITYYHADAICPLSAYLRRQHLLRTWHSVDADKVPPYSPDNRRTCLLSGAHGMRVYPLRHRLFRNAQYLPVETREHPGYAAEGCDTDNFLFALAHYKVAICTASSLNYALRKIIEATACGCRVITNLPAWDALPMIDGNLIRVPSHISLPEISALISRAANEYDPATQAAFAAAACDFYDFRRRGRELAAAIDALRQNYSGATP